MKRILLTILTFIYFALSVRATVHLHDCMDIFTASVSDIHTDEQEKGPCKNDPSQCKLEAQRRVIEAPSKWLRVVDEILVPVSAFRSPQYSKIFLQSSSGLKYPQNTNTTSLLIFHCLWRI